MAFVKEQQEAAKEDKAWEHEERKIEHGEHMHTKWRRSVANAPGKPNV